MSCVPSLPPSRLFARFSRTVLINARRFSNSFSFNRSSKAVLNGIPITSLPVRGRTQTGHPGDSEDHPHPRPQKRERRVQARSAPNKKRSGAHEPFASQVSASLWSQSQKIRRFTINQLPFRRVGPQPLQIIVQP